MKNSFCLMLIPILTLLIGCNKISEDSNTSSSNNNVTLSSSSLSLPSNNATLSSSSLSSSSNNVSSSNNNVTLSSNSLSSSNRSYIEDDQYDVIQSQKYSYPFYTYQELSLYISNSKAQLNNNSFYTLNSQYAHESMYQHYILSCDDNTNGNLKNPTIREKYCIFDEELGFVKDTSYDVPYYSISINCLFFSLENKEKITNYKLEYIADSKIKITLECNNLIAGYLYFYFGPLDAESYIINYINNNLILI